MFGINLTCILFAITLMRINSISSRKDVHVNPVPKLYNIIYTKVQILH